jgi:hypothetical protein
MPVTIKANSGGGSVTLDAGTTSTDTTLTLPSTTGSVLVAPGGILPASAGGTGLSAPGTNGNVLTSNGTAWTSAAPSGGGAPSAIGQIPFSTNGSTYTPTQKIVQGTAVTLTSQTSVDFTSIPSWVKRVTIIFYGASTNGTSQWLVQIGSTTFTTSGYSGAGFGFSTTGSVSSSTSGFLIYNDNAGDAKSGLMTID